MEKKIIIKEIDKLTGCLYTDRVVSEYLICVSLLDGTTNPKLLEAYTEFGEVAKKDRVNELILIHFMGEDMQNVPLKNEIIEEITFEQYKNQLENKWKKKNNTH